MYDKDDPLDESEDLGQHNQDLEEAGHGDQVNSAAGTIAGAAGTLLTAGMLLGPRLTLQRRRQRVREWVCTPVTCPDCACGVCCALDLCGTECQHVQQDGEQAQAGDKPQPALTTLPTSFRVPTPKTSSRYSQQALLEEVRVQTQSTLEQIAASGKFLDIELGIECPDGEVIKVMARFDTGSNLDVIDPTMAAVLKKHKIHWGHEGGQWVELAGKQHAQVAGSLLLPITITGRQLDLPRRLNFDLEAQVLGSPAGVDMLLGLPTLVRTGILQAVIDKHDRPREAVTADSHLDEDSDGLEEVLWPELTEETVLPQLFGSPAERQALQQLVMEFLELFGPAPKGGSKLRPMSIRLKEGIELPQPSPARRVSPAVLQEIAEDTKLRMDNGWLIEAPAGAPCRFASPVVAIKQPGKEKRRCCGDYRKINEITHQHQYPVKNGKEVLARMHGKYLGKGDMYKGYFQVPLDEATQELLAVRSPLGLHRPTTLPFGPKGGPAEFQERVSRDVLQGLEGHGIESYLDDLGIHADTFEEFLTLLRKLFERLRRFDLRLNGKKCQFGCSEMEFLGHYITQGGVRHLDTRMEAVKNMAVPETKSQLRSFTGLVNYFREACPRLGLLMAPLHAVGGNSQGRIPQEAWGEEQQQAFELCKKAVCEARTLHWIDYTKPIKVRSDACDIGAGAMLFQLIDGREVPVAFWSKAFTATERRWSTYEQETFALVASVLHWESLLLGHKFSVEIDHKNMLWMYKSDTPKVVRWRLRLAPFDFDINHIPGNTNLVADALSRLHPLTVPAEPQLVPGPSVSAMDRGAHIDIDMEFIAKVGEFHNNVRGHAHGKELVDRMRKAGHDHSHIWEHIKWATDNCPMCQKVLAGKASMTATIKTIKVCQPGEEWSVDTIGPLPADEEGNCYVLVVIDSFTRFVALKPTKTVDAMSAAKFVFELSGFFGRPKSIRSDGGSQFANHIVEGLLKLMGINKHTSLAYRPQANGLVERCIKEVVKHLRYIILERRVQENWSTYLPMVQRIINATVHSGIGVAPAKLVFGGMVDMDRCLVPDKVPSVVLDGIELIKDNERRIAVAAYLDHLVQAQQIIVQRAQEHQDAMVKSRMGRYNPKNPESFEVGDWVLLQWEGGRRPTKLSVEWKGPYIVVEHDSVREHYKLQDPTDLKIMKPVHATRLRRYKMGLTEPADVNDLVSMDTVEAPVVAIVDHEMFVYDGKRKKALPKARWRFLARYEDGEEVWLSWREADPLAALDDYAQAHPELKIPAR